MAKKMSMTLDIPTIGMRCSHLSDEGLAAYMRLKLKMALGVRKGELRYPLSTYARILYHDEQNTKRIIDELLRDALFSSSYRDGMLELRDDAMIEEEKVRERRREICSKAGKASRAAAAKRKKELQAVLPGLEHDVAPDAEHDVERYVDGYVEHHVEHDVQHDAAPCSPHVAAAVRKTHRPLYQKMTLFRRRKKRKPPPEKVSDVVVAVAKTELHVVPDVQHDVEHMSSRARAYNNNINNSIVDVVDEGEKKKEKEGVGEKEKGKGAKPSAGVPPPPAGHADEASKQSLPPSDVAVLRVEDCLSAYFDTDLLKVTRDRLCLEMYIGNDDLLRDWAEAFNNNLIGGGTVTKQFADWKRHFRNWLKKQDCTINPKKIHEHRQQESRRGPDKGASNRPHPEGHNVEYKRKLAQRLGRPLYPGGDQPNGGPG